MNTTSFGGASYFMLCKDNNIGYMFLIFFNFLKTKSEALIHLKQLCSLMKQELNVDIQRIKTNQGGEFKNHQFESYTHEKGIIHEFSAAYALEQNGSIERNNRTSVEATRSMLHSRDLSLTLSAEAASTTVFVWNRTVNMQLENTTPFEQMFKQIPDMSYFRAFGSDAYLHIPKQHRTKLDAKSQKLILVGYDQKGRAYRLWNPSTKRILVGIDVVIHENLGIQTRELMPTSTKFHPESITVSIPNPRLTPTYSNSNANLPTSSDTPSVSMPSLSEGSKETQGDSIPQELTQEVDASSETNSVLFASLSQTLEIPIAPVQGEIMVPLHLDSDSPSSNTLTTSSNMSESDERAHEVNNSNEEDIGYRLKPRSRNPPLRYGDWVKYDDNKSKAGSAAYIAVKSKSIHEPKTCKETMNSPHVEQ